MQTGSTMAPPAVGPDEMLAVAWFGKVSVKSSCAGDIGSYLGSSLIRNTSSALQEKVEVIRAKKPHIVESVSLIPLSRCWKVWQTNSSITKAV